MQIYIVTLIIFSECRQEKLKRVKNNMEKKEIVKAEEGKERVMGGSARMTELFAQTRWGKKESDTSHIALLTPLSLSSILLFFFSEFLTNYYFKPRKKWVQILRPTRGDHSKMSMELIKSNIGSLVRFIAFSLSRVWLDIYRFTFSDSGPRYSGYIHDFNAVCELTVAFRNYSQLQSGFSSPHPYCLF